MGFFTGNVFIATPLAATAGNFGRERSRPFPTEKTDRRFSLPPTFYSHAAGDCGEPVKPINLFLYSALV